MPDTWNPRQYDRFKHERSQPFYDLLDLVRPVADARVVDLGCGTGHLTAILHERLHARRTRGIDTSASMLARHPPDGPGLEFAQADIATFDDSGWDVVFSNAALHWLTDHPALIARLAGLLASGGQIAIQMPANNDHATHVVAQALAATPQFSDAMGGYQREWPVLAPEAYARILHSLGCSEMHVRLQVYPHVLPSRDDVVEWVRGTLLTDYEQRLSPTLFAEFLAAYRARLTESLPDERPFFFPFKRVLIWARRTG